MDIKAILSSNTDAETGKTDFEAVAKTINTELPKEWIPKAEFNTQSEQLKEAQKTMSDLQRANEGNANLQQQIDDWKLKFETSQQDFAKERGKQSIKDELQKLGGDDLDYLLYQYGDIKMNQDGTVSNRDNRLKELQEKFKDHFKASDPESPTDPLPNGFKQFDNKLPNGENVNPMDAVSAAFANAVGLQSQTK